VTLFISGVLGLGLKNLVLFTSLASTGIITRRTWTRSYHHCRCRQLWWAFVGLPDPNIWFIFGHGVKRSGDLDLLPFVG